MSAVEAITGVKISGRADERWVARFGGFVVVALLAGLGAGAWWGGVRIEASAPALIAPAARPVQALQPAALREAAAQFLLFEPNRGQAAPAVRYVSHGPRHHAEVFDDGIALSAPASGNAADAWSEAQLRFIGAGREAAFQAREPSPGVASYLYGADSAKWIRDVPRFRQLRRSELYPGIDLVYYSREGELEFDLVVSAGADPSQIRMQLGGRHAPAIAADGALLLDGPDGTLRLHRPVLYQNIEGQRKVLDAHYVLRGDREVGFDLPAYDKRYPLVIDPVVKLLYSTYLGGVHDDQVGAMVLDAKGNAYVVGNSGSEDWPVSANAYQAARKTLGQYYRDVVVTKFDPAGTLIYSTFIGGAVDDYASGVAVDATGRAYVTGYTQSTDFPVTPGAHQTVFRGSQSAFLAVLSPDGSALNYSTLYGGNGGSQGASVALDPAGAIVLAGQAGPGLATTSGAYKAALAAGSAAFVAKFSPYAAGAPQLVAASYYGVDNPESNSVGQGNSVLSMALDASGAPWITGQAFTTRLPLTAGAVQAAPPAVSSSCAPGPGPLNGFAYVAKLSANLGSLAYASYLSGQTESAGATACSEFGRAIALDGAGNVYVSGGTGSASFPTTSGAVQTTTPAGNGFASYTSFLAKLKPDGSGLLWSTYFGGNVGSTFPSGSLIIDSADTVWMGTSTGGGSNYPITTADATQATHGGGSFDAGVARFDAATGALRFSTYFGGNGSEGVSAMAVDAAGNALIAGATNSTNLPVTATAFQPQLTANAYDGSDWFFSVLGTGTIASLSRTSTGNAGDTTVYVSGTGIVTGATASLIPAGGGANIAARTTAKADTGGRYPFTFPLDAAAVGSYDLLVHNPDGTELRKADALNVTAGTGPNLAMSIVGRSAIRVGTSSKYEITVANSGDADAYYAVVRVALPSGVQTKFGFGASIPMFPGDTTDYNANPGTTIDNGTAYTLVYFPIVPAGMSATTSLELTAADSTDFSLEAILLPSYLPSIDLLRQAVGLQAANADRMHALAGAGRMRPLITRVDASKCASDIILLVAAGAATAAGLGTGGAVAAAMAVLTGVIASSLVNGPQGQSLQGQGYEAAQNALQSYLSNTMQNILGVINIANDCDPDGSLRDRIIHAITPKASIDPNDKSGPAGDGSALHYVRSVGAIPYQIGFENQASAGLPAAQVVVTDQLDAATFDLSSVTLGSISWGSHRIAVPAGLTSYSTVYNIDSTMSVRVQGSLDASTGVLKWTFTTIDPVTKLPPSDPTLGFLPPDTDGVKGQGYVAFTVAAKSGMPEGTVWQNSASIVFDANAPIVTPTWKNTLDATAPTSHVTALTPKAGSSSFDVTWSGTDTASGVRSYTVFVSDNGGAYKAWQMGVSTTSATYDGTAGHTYGFYAIATDGAGNVEAGKSAAEASIVAGDASGTPGSSSSSGGGGGCTIGGDDQRDVALPILLLAAIGVLLMRRLNARERSTRSMRRARD